MTVMIDYATYSFLYHQGIAGINLAKAVGFFVGTLFAYVANSFWTFGRKKYSHASILRFFLLYAVTLLINIEINKRVLSFLYISPLSIGVGFMAATITSALINFFGMRSFVFDRNCPKGDKSEILIDNPMF